MKKILITNSGFQMRFIAFFLIIIMSSMTFVSPNKLQVSKEIAYLNTIKQLTNELRLQKEYSEFLLKKINSTYNSFYVRQLQGRLILRNAF